MGRFTCLVFAVSSFCALKCRSVYVFAVNVAMLANETSSGIVSAFWCSSSNTWTMLVAVESLFVVVATQLLIRLRLVTFIHGTYATFVSINGHLYLQTRLSSETSSPEEVGAPRRLQDNEGMANWAITVIVLVCCLIFGMVAIGYFHIGNFRSWCAKKLTPVLMLQTGYSADDVVRDLKKKLRYFLFFRSVRTRSCWAAS